MPSMADNLRRLSAEPKCSVTEAAAILHTSRETIRRMILRGELCAWPARKGGTKLLLFRNQVVEMREAEIKKAIRRGKMMQSTFSFF